MKPRNLQCSLMYAFFLVWHSQCSSETFCIYLTPENDGLCIHCQQCGRKTVWMNGFIAGTVNCYTSVKSLKNEFSLSKNPMHFCGQKCEHALIWHFDKNVLVVWPRGQSSGFPRYLLVLSIHIIPSLGKYIAHLIWKEIKLPIDDTRD